MLKSEFVTWLTLRLAAGREPTGRERRVALRIWKRFAGELRNVRLADADLDSWMRKAVLERKVTR